MKFSNRGSLAGYLKYIYYIIVKATLVGNLNSKYILNIKSIYLYYISIIILTQI